VPLENHLRRRRLRAGSVGAFAVAALAALSWADHRGLLLYAGGDLERYDGRSFRVTRVLDGDTLDVDAPDPLGQGRATTRIRFWGIDAPEITHVSPAGTVRPGEPFGDEATRFTRDRAEGKSVTLRLEPHRFRDPFGRLIAYVELPDGRLLNVELVEAGMARAETRWTHRLLLRFVEDERAAKAEGRGMWRKGRSKANADDEGQASAVD
jgi:micrococcal nuclease